MILRSKNIVLTEIISIMTVKMYGKNIAKSSLNHSGTAGLWSSMNPVYHTNISQCLG